MHTCLLLPPTPILQVTAASQELFVGDVAPKPAAWFVILPKETEECGPVTLRPLADHASLDPGSRVLLAFLDASPAADALGSAARNLLTWAAARWRPAEPVALVSMRARNGRFDPGASTLVRLTLPPVAAAPAAVPNWETNSRGKPGPRKADLGAAADPARLAASGT